jgi:hypothetical protein
VPQNLTSGRHKERLTPKSLILEVNGLGVTHRRRSVAGRLDPADVGPALCGVRLEDAVKSYGDEFSAALCPPPTIALRAGTSSCRRPPGRNLGPAYPHLGDTVAPGSSRGVGGSWWEERISRCGAHECLPGPHTRGLSVGDCGSGGRFRPPMVGNLAEMWPGWALCERYHIVLSMILARAAVPDSREA